MKIERRDVYGADPFKGDEYARPWLVVNNEIHPFHGGQYVVLPLTTRSWHDGFVGIPDRAWTGGGTPEPSSVVPWSVETLEHRHVDYWQGTLERSLVDRVVSRLTTYLKPAKGGWNLAGNR